MEFEGWVYGTREQTELAIRELKRDREMVSRALSGAKDKTQIENLNLQISGINEKIFRFEKALSFGFTQKYNYARR